MNRARDRSHGPWWAGALAGVAGGALGIGAGEVLAALGNPAAAPLTAVGQSFINLVPGWLKDLAVELFGTADKLALSVGELVVVAALLGLLGALGLWRRVIMIAGFVLLALLAAVAAMTRPGAGQLDWVPALACGVVGVLAVSLLLRRVDGAAAPSNWPFRSRVEPATARQSRRGFLVAVGGTAAVAVLAGVAARGLGAASRAAEAARAAVRIPSPRSPVATAPAGLDQVPGITTYQTPNAEFYRIDTALSVPQIDPKDWRLRIHGRVEREIEISYAQLLGTDRSGIGAELSEGLTGDWVTLTCVSNEVGGHLAGNAVWVGRLIREVLALAKPQPSADMVLSTSDDGWTASTPLEILLEENRSCLFAVEMNGEPLPIEHGFPVRMVVPGLYGYVSATKWVTDLEVTTFAEATAYWTTRGWAPKGPIKTASRIDVPQSGDSVEAGTVVIAGVAWAQHRGITAVEVQVDEGPWQQAKLAPTVGPDTWRQWSLAWQATSGDHRLRVRATDGEGMVQTATEAPPAPDGASGFHQVDVTVN